MTRLTAQDIAEFQALFRKETGREISPEQLAEYAEGFIRVVAFAKEMPREPGAVRSIRATSTNPSSLCPRSASRPARQDAPPT